jgi:putative membrane protein
VKSKVYRPRSSVSRYYLLLFNLPKWEYLAVFLIATSLLIVVLFGEKSVPIILGSLFSMLVLSAYRVIYRETVFWKMKRVIGLALAVAVYSSVYTVLTKDVVVSVASSTALLSVVVMGLDGTCSARYLVVTAPPLLSLVVSSAYGIISREQLVLGASLTVLVALLDVAIYLFMSRRRINNYRLPDIGTLFLRNWLDRRTDIERVFEETGVYETVHPRVLEFPDFVIVYSDVHYGPFSNIGSSRLPEHISEFFTQVRGVRAVALHGLGSHDRNIVSRKFVNDYMRNLKETFTSGFKEPLMYYGSFALDYSDWSALCIVFDKLSIVFVSRPGKGIDDLPYELQEEYELKALSRGLGDFVIVDTHNWELEEGRRIREVGDLRKLLDMVLEHIDSMKKTRDPVRVRSKIAWFKSTAPGLINGEGCIFFISGEGREEACIVYLRGNNMKPGVRNMVLEKLKSLGLRFVEVVTNDEHGETATRAHIAYIPVHDTPELLRDIEETARNLMNTNYHEDSFYWSTRMNLKLAGLTVFKLEEALKKSIRETALILLLYVFATPLVIATVLTLL